MPAPAKHLLLGKAGEEATVGFLCRLGWRIIERNWRPGGQDSRFELDIIARDADELVFVEVKTRSAKRFGPDPSVSAHAAFTRAKRAGLARAAGRYLALHDCWNAPCRFDLVCVEWGREGNLKLEHHRHVIELGRLVDSGHASWQPW